MRLRYPGTCRVCGVELAAGAEAIYERTSKTVRCVSHDAVAPLRFPSLKVVDEAALDVVESGTAGASARREFERRKAARDQRIRAKHPKLGGLILGVTDQPRSTTAWDVGAIGEERLGQGLDRMASDRVRVLHDRRIPRSTANIDHLVVTASGVYVIDAKKYRGRPHLKIDGGLFRPRVERLLVGSARLHQTRRRSAQADRRGATTSQRRRPDPRCALLCRSRLALARRTVSPLAAFRPSGPRSCTSSSRQKARLPSH